MAWVQEQRLQRAQEHETVASIALDCGITRLGAFASFYAERFGELPSQTLKQRRSP